MRSNSLASIPRSTSRNLHPLCNVSRFHTNLTSTQYLTNGIINHVFPTILRLKVTYRCCSFFIRIPYHHIGKILSIKSEDNVRGWENLWFQGSTFVCSICCTNNFDHRWAFSESLLSAWTRESGIGPFRQLYLCMSILPDHRFGRWKYPDIRKSGLWRWNLNAQVRMQECIAFEFIGSRIMYENFSLQLRFS